MMDVSLLKDPVFMMIGISNIFGMAGLYVPFVYLVDAAVLDVSLRKIILDSPISYFLHTLKIRRIKSIPKLWNGLICNLQILNL